MTIIIISLLQCTAGHRPLQSLAISKKIKDNSSSYVFGKLDITQKLFLDIKIKPATNNVVQLKTEPIRRVKLT
jgi:hypothetical protein